MLSLLCRYVFHLVSMFFSNIFPLTLCVENQVVCRKIFCMVLFSLKSNCSSSAVAIRSSTACRSRPVLPLRELNALPSALCHGTTDLVLGDFQNKTSVWQMTYVFFLSCIHTQISSKTKLLTAYLKIQVCVFHLN